MDRYPTISLTELSKISTILQNASDDPKYLDGRICPYDPQTREALKSLIINPTLAASLDAKPKTRKKTGPKAASSVISQTDLENEFNDLRKEIQTLKTDAVGLEPHERIQVIKTRAALIEKILQMKERIGNLNKVNKFMAIVMEILEMELDQDARLRVIEKLEEFKEKD